MFPRSRMILGSVLVALAAAGCGPTLPMSDDGEYLSAAPSAGVVGRLDSPIPDLPMPIGFTILARQSRVDVDQAGVRTVKHVYQGRASVQAVVDFYRRNVPLHDWRFQSEGSEADEYALYYYKGPERLRLATVTRGMVTSIIVLIEPRPTSGP